MTEKKVIINLSIAPDVRRRLDDLAQTTGWTLGNVLERAILAFSPGPVAVPPPPPAVDLSDVLDRLAALETYRKESASRPGVDMDVDTLVNRITSIHAALSQELTDLRSRVSTLEFAYAISGAVEPEPASIPHLDTKPTEIAADSAVVAIAESTDITVSETSTPSSCETEADETVLADDKPDMEALMASIPEKEFTGVNGKRNRRIIELHCEKLGTSQISKALIAENIINSGEGSVQYFLKKVNIEPNHVGRWQKTK